jgi:molecular chaperone GrpE
MENKDEEIKDELNEETVEEETKEAADKEVVEENDELTKALELAKANEDKFLRTLAEFDNFRKRTVAEKAGIYDNGVKDTIEKFLAVTDNFERAVSFTAEEEKNTSLYKGVEMIFGQFNEILDNLGVKEVAGAGEIFDPNVHNAVMHIEDDSLGENVIAEVLQKGYTYKDKVIRPAMVKVAN